TLLLFAEYAVKRKPLMYVLTLVAFVLGLMSKPMLVTLPLVMLMMDYWPLGRYRDTAQSERFSHLIPLVKEKIPFFACSLLSSAITIYAQHKGGSIASLDHISVGSRIENALISYVAYIGKTVWPHDLAVLYPMPSSFPLWQVIGSVLVILIVSAATIRVGRRYPYLPAGWFWYLVTLVPVIGIVQVGAQSMADRYMYIPVTGLFVMVAWGVPDLVKGLKYREGILALAAGIVITASAVVTWQQLGYWRDTVSLFQHTLQVTSGNRIIHNNLGYALLDKGRLDEAIQEFHEALRISPDYANAHFYLGLALAKKGNGDAAIQEYREALRLKPEYSEAHNNLGVTLANKGDIDAALQEYKEALRINPNDHDTHNNLGLVFARTGDLDGATRAFQEALRLKPDHSEAHSNLGFVHASQGNLDAAIREFQEALRINPNHANAYNNLRLALDQKRIQGEVRK
ncbi:MAG: tetratricopeptide repeat protein, partial [Chlorobiales bacterium]|nr:tetratricopeptide repeat protein [Chlorobiales bacterium]